LLLAVARSNTGDIQFPLVSLKLQLFSQQLKKAKVIG